MLRKPFILTFVLFALVTALTFVTRAPVHAAAPFVVTSNVDAQDANPGDGVCASQHNGCTLRAAVAEVNQGKGDQIQLAADTFYILSGGELHIKSDVSIQGGGASSVLDGQNSTRLVRVSNDATVALYNVTLTRGKAENGGAIRLESGFVWLERVKVVQNSATKYGGAIYSDDLLLIKDSTIALNTAEQLGGGIYNTANLEVASSTFNDNTANVYHGGAIYGATNSLTRVINSTISTNRAGTHAGGIYVGINADAELYSTTVVYNKSDNQNTNQGAGGGIYNFGGGFLLFNTLVAHNTLENGATDTNSDCGGAFSASYSMVRTVTGCTLNNTGGSFTGFNVALGALEDNGGTTRTHALVANSVLIDKGDATGCKGYGGFALPYDQRGNTRAFDGDGINSARCDIGAYEWTGDTAQCAGKPEKPILTKPADASVKTNLKVKLDWEDSNCATTYKVIVRRDSKKGPKVDSANGLPESKYKTIQLAAGHTYFWKVKACSAAGCKGSVPFTFSIP